MKQLKELKDNLDLEVTNIRSNSDLMDKNLDDGTKWDDVELLDCKEIFIKMMDWIRNYDTSSEEYTRKIRFTAHDGVNDLARRILEIGDLKMQDNNPKSEDAYEPRSSGLSRSKSDHRLVTEFRRQEENSSPTRSRRAFGYSREANKSRSNMGYGGDEEETSSYSSRFSSRFLSRPGDEDAGEDRRNSKHMEEEPMSKKERNKVIETEDASRGPLSGCIRLADSSRVIQRLKVSDSPYLVTQSSAFIKPVTWCRHPCIRGSDKNHWRPASTHRSSWGNTMRGCFPNSCQHLSLLSMPCPMTHGL